MKGLILTKVIQHVWGEAPVLKTIEQEYKFYGESKGNFPAPCRAVVTITSDKRILIDQKGFMSLTDLLALAEAAKKEGDDLQVEMLEILGRQERILTKEAAGVGP